MHGSLDFSSQGMPRSSAIHFRIKNHSLQDMFVKIHPGSNTSLNGRSLVIGRWLKPGGTYDFAISSSLGFDHNQYGCSLDSVGFHLDTSVGFVGLIYAALTGQSADPTYSVSAYYDVVGDPMDDLPVNGPFYPGMGVM